MCLASSNDSASTEMTCCSCYRMLKKKIPQTCNLLVCRRMMQTLFSILHHRSPIIFANTTVVAFVQLRKPPFNFHCYTQREAMPIQKLAQKWQLQPFGTSCVKDYNGHSLVQTSFTELPNSTIRQRQALKV